MNGVANGLGELPVASRHEVVCEPIPNRLDGGSRDPAFLFCVALTHDQEIFEGLAKETLRRGHARRCRGLAQLRPERAQDHLMRQTLPPGQTIDLNRLGQTRSNRLRQLAEKAAEQLLFVRAKHTQTRLAAAQAAVSDVTRPQIRMARLTAS